MVRTGQGWKEGLGFAPTTLGSGGDGQRSGSGTQ